MLYNSCKQCTCLQGPSAQLHVHAAHALLLQSLLCRAGEVQAISTQPQHGQEAQAPVQTAQANASDEKRTRVRLGSTSGSSSAAVEGPEQCFESLQAPVWTAADLTLPLDTQQMAQTRRTILRAMRDRHASSMCGASANLDSPPEPIGASWLSLGEDEDAACEHPCTMMSQQGWMQVWVIPC
jgi:hypothetical protein